MQTSDECRERKRQYYLANKERIKQRVREYRARNRNDINARLRERRLADPEGVRAKARANYAYNLEVRRETARAYYKKTRRKQLERRLREKFNITFAERDELLAQQGGVCAICRGDNSSSSRDWHVDHCHDTGKVRGILCHHCNVGLGYFRNTAAHLRAAIRYLGYPDEL